MNIKKSILSIIFSCLIIFSCDINRNNQPRYEIEQDISIDSKNYRKTNELRFFVFTQVRVDYTTIYKKYELNVHPDSLETVLATEHYYAYNAYRDYKDYMKKYNRKNKENTNVRKQTKK